MSKKEPELLWVEPDLTERELLAVIATALNRIVITLESIDARQRKSDTKRFVLKGVRGRR
jgi:hypothetical protein